MPDHVEIPEIPVAQSDRVELVGQLAIHPTRWHSTLCQRLGISRTTLYRYAAGRQRWMRNIDARLLALISREKADARARHLRLAALEKKFGEFVGRRPQR